MLFEVFDRNQVRWTNTNGRCDHNEGLRDRETNPCDLAIHDDVVHSIAGSSTRFLYLYSPGIHREFADIELEVTVPKSGETGCHPDHLFKLRRGVCLGCRG